MIRKVRWGVLGAANIALVKVIPAMQRGTWSEITAIASRDPAKAQEAARALGIPKAYGSYEELVADPDIEAVYNPLPNHLHVPWSIRCAEAGKHVLCEKPVALDAAEARTLLDTQRRTGVKIGEAFMVRTHPQWLRTREIVRSGRIGDLRAIQGFFSYFNRDADNIRNVREWGGGGLMDIGCYPINTSRFIFGEEPRRVMGLVERDPEMHIDCLASGILDFPSGQASFACSRKRPPTSACSSSEPRAASRSKFRSTRRPTGPHASSWMMPRTCSAQGSKPKLSPSAINTRSKATCSRKPFAVKAKCRCRWRTPETYGCHRCAVPLRRIGPVGNALRKRKR